MEMFRLCASLFLLPLMLRGAQAQDCGAAAFRAGSENFVLDARDAVRDGAALLATRNASTSADCWSLCCADPRCNLALLKPRDEDAEELSRTCVLWDCVHRSRFACRFVNKPGYESYIRTSTYRRYLEAPGEQAPPIANAGRDVVVRPGETVTLNGSESLALHDAKIREYRWSQQSEGVQLKLERTKKRDQIRLSHLQPGSYVLKLAVTDSNSRTSHDAINVLVLSPELSTLYCLAPPKVGPCRAAFPRWHYDVETGGCTGFIYGGCKPNRNNFLSEGECLAACRGVTASPERSIVLPAKEECGSECRADQLTCDSGCCLDRSLECDDEKQCGDGSDENGCSKLSETFSHLLSVNISQAQAGCVEPPLTGPCRAKFTRWYYNPIEGKCRRFTFGGCDGNDNNFEEEEQCSDTCKGITVDNIFSRGIFDRFEGDEEETTESGSIALAVIVAVAILALLAVLGYCFLRRRSEGSSRPAGPPHVSLSEQDTLVYNNTTKPA